MTDTTDDRMRAYERVLADLRSQRANLDAAISALETAMGITSANATRAEAQDQRSTVDGAAFLGMSIPEAARKYLEISKRPQTTAQIASALRDGGVHTTSSNFLNTVYTALKRQADVLRLGDKWSLKEWHPRARVPGAEPAAPSASEPPSEQ